MKLHLRLGEGGSSRRYFEVLEYRYSSDDLELQEGWIDFDFTGLGFPSGQFLLESESNSLIKKPAQKNPGEVFDIDTCSWVMPLSAQWDLVRAQRDALLKDTDWRVARAQEVGQPLDPVWVDYRQALRDITLQADPFAIVWPPAPVEQSTEAPTEAQH